MAQKPIQVIYKETEEKIVAAVNEALNQGVPMFVIEPMLKLIHTEAKANTDMQYQEQMQAYRTALTEEAMAAEASNEATSA
jgi:hypothetical protein